MKYDIDDVALRVESAKNKFKATVIICALIIAVAALVAIYLPETTVVFLCAATVIGAIAYLCKYLSRNNPVIIFSQGFKGVNVKEHEYVTAGTRFTRYGGISYRYIPSRHKGDVYVQRDDGEIVVVSHLPKKHLDIYEIGDTLVCYPGTRFPVVDGRDVPEQPCPICGFVNQNGDEKCSSCGLKALKGK